MKIRHLVLTESFAGAEQHVCVLAREQASQGHEVEVWGGDPKAMQARLGDGVAHTACGSVGAALRRSRSAGQVDVIHAHMTKAETAATVGAWMTGSAALVATRHFAAVRGSSRMGRLARPVLRRAIDAQIAVSEFVAHNIDGRSTVVYAGVPAQPEVTSARADVVLVAQRLSPEKRTRDALDAFAASGLPGDGWRLEIAGRGAQQSQLVSHADALGIGRQVEFLGFVDDLPGRMQQASVLLAPAPAEPFGLTVVEAMSHGTPVVATASGGHLETVGRVGRRYLYPVGRAEQAGSLLADLAADSRGRQTYGHELRAVQRELFTPHRQFAETQRVYEMVLGR